MGEETMKDSRLKTREHALVVGQRIGLVISELHHRALTHDDSKQLPPEVGAFDRVTEKLAGLTYGSVEYKESLEELGPALQHHYANNRHHPEHFPNGVAGMNLVDLVEMLCDWCAATKRHADGDLDKSITINAERFGLDPQLVSILRNTAEWVRGKG
jgi:hypothetical protein